MPDQPMTPADLALIADAVRVWANALDQAGLPPARYVSREHRAAVIRLMALYPAAMPDQPMTREDEA